MTQAKRTLLTLGALVAVAAGLGLYAYFGVMRTDEAEAERKAVDGQLFAVRREGEKAPDGGTAAAEFTAITVHAKGETSVLERGAEGKWSLTAPVRADTDRFAVEALVNQLQSAQLKEKVEDAPDDAALAKFGLKPPQFELTAKATVAGGGGEPREVKVVGGIENPFDGTVYVRKDDDPAVYTVEGGVRWSLEKTPYDLRNKEVLSLDETKVKTLEVTGVAKPFALEQTAPKLWRLTRPVASAADAASVSSLLSALRSERAASFPKAPPPAGKVEATLTATLDGGETWTWTLQRPAGDAGGALLVKRQHGEEVLWAEVNESALTGVQRDPAELRDRSVLSFRQDQVAQLAFRLADGSELVVQKQAVDAGAPEGWDVTAPKRGPAKKWKVSSLLWALSSLRWTEEGEAQPKDAARYGLGPKAPQVVLSDSSGNELARLLVGKQVAGKPDTVYVQGAQGRVFEADATRLAELPKATGDLLEGASAPATDAGAPSVQ